MQMLVNMSSEGAIIKHNGEVCRLHDEEGGQHHIWPCEQVSRLCNRSNYREDWKVINRSSMKISSDCAQEVLRTVSIFLCVQTSTPDCCTAVCSG